MSTYAIGDIQGCFEPFVRLLDEVGFDPDRDRVWLLGDLVNRGPQSLDVLRWCVSHKDNVEAVLGNHDVHLLALDYGVQSKGAKDTLDEVLEAPDKGILLDWLRNRPFVHTEGDFMMVHAGLLPSWSQSQALRLAQEVEDILRGPDAPLFLAQYRDFVPPGMEDATSSMQRARYILAVLTRIRICDSGGRPDWSFKKSPEEIPEGYSPWFRAPVRSQDAATILCGHWAALGLHQGPRVVALDTGCVWGRKLTAFRLEDRAVFQVSA
jgi:bis(5'-nucleosyl)-tetraphosphatase (symmetrical)